MERRSSDDPATLHSVADDPPPEKSDDVALVYSPTDDGEGLRIVRSRGDGNLELAEVRQAPEGKPLHG